jgi:hypothetical protein
MGEVYGLYSTRDGQIRYVGQTEYTTRKSLDLLVTKALDREPGALCDWVRGEWRANHEVRAHILQDEIVPADLEMFEAYWIAQFSSLLNAQEPADSTRKTSEIAGRIHDMIRTQLRGETTTD